MNFYEIKNLKENIDIDTKDDLFFAKKFFKNNLLMNINKKKGFY